MQISAEVRPQAGDALLIVDVQRDFLPGGSLPVPAGDEVVAPLNDWVRRFTLARQPIYATRDWHPPDHCSFREQGGQGGQGGIWPSHCVAGTPGAEFAPTLVLPATVCLVSKATLPEADAYSGFAGTDLDAQLRYAAVRRLFVGGLATDYCVLNTVNDALRQGYEVVLLLDAMRAVNVHAGDGERALAAMLAAGAATLKG
ncbi:MAG: isochorismatase family protein [Sterolibacterium sp.]